MPKYLIRSRYTAQGASGLLKEGGTSRRAESERAIRSVGGSLESFYFAFGGTDVFIIADLPDNASMASLNIAASASGAIAGESVVLLTPEEVDEATRKGAAFRPPGG